MAFKLKGNKPFDHEIKLIIKDRIDEAIDQIIHQPDGFDEAIHEMRVSCKRIRAVLRVIRCALGETLYKQENQRFRMISKPYNDIRDASVLLNTIQALKNHYTRDIVPGSFYQTEQMFQKKYDLLLSQDYILTSTLAELKDGRQWLSGWIFRDDEWDIIKSGLKRTYQRSQFEFQKSHIFPFTRRLHEWRKQTKYLFYQLQLLRKFLPPRLKKKTKDYAHIGRLLGDDHDLAVLKSFIMQPSFDAHQQEKRVLLTTIDLHVSQLREEIFKIGQFLYKDTPKNFIQKIEKYWKS